MPDRKLGAEAGEPALRAEIVRLNKIVQALMDRSERTASGQASAYSQFQSALTLQEEVRARTAQLEAALRANEKIERTLRESEAKFRGLVDQSLVGIVVVEDGRFVYSNTKFNEMFGYSAEEVLALNPLETAIESDRPWMSEQLSKRLDGRAQRINYLFRGRRKDGEERDVECHGSALAFGAGAPLVSVLLDVTERKRADDALRASLREKEALLKETHHRVKNNLALIASLMRLEAGRSHEAETKAALKEMQARIHSVALLNQTLYQSGSYSRVDLTNYLKLVATQLFRAQAPDDGAVRLVLEFGDVEVETAQAIPCGLLVNELMTNSLKHAFPGGRGGTLSISLGRRPDGRVTVSVGDTGVGLPADFAMRQRTSLGLQLVGDLTKQLRGTLEVGPGPVFKLSFLPSTEEA